MYDITLYVFIQPLCHQQDVTQGQFLSSVCQWSSHTKDSKNGT